MKRLGFTIILNGLHHLLHNDYADYLLTNVYDYWVIVEGSVKNSTPWCPGDISKYHNNGRSIDGTNLFLYELEKNILIK